MIEVMELVKSAILGVIQGITEWLPISSTGHMILVNEFLHLKGSDNFINTYLVLVQLGSILAVVVLYFKKLWPFSFKNSKKENKKIWTLWFKILVACIPAGIVGLLFDDLIDKYFYNPFVIAFALIIVGVGFLVFESLHIAKTIQSLEDIDFLTAFEIGAFQMMALIPGTSRSGSTIMGGSVLGCTRQTISEFSFFVAIPVMVGASGLKILKCGFDFTMAQWVTMAVGFVVAFVVSLFAIKFLTNYIKKHDFKAFGIYRIILGIAVILYFYVF